jgi:hypothetical protein
MPTIRATVTEKRDGYTVRVILTANGETQQLVETIVLSHFEAEAITRAHAALHNILWNKVEVVSQ